MTKSCKLIPIPLNCIYFLKATTKQQFKCKIMLWTFQTFLLNTFACVNVPCYRVARPLTEPLAWMTSYYKTSFPLTVVSGCSGGAVEEYERLVSFLHLLCLFSLVCFSLLGETDQSIGTHLGLDRTGRVVCVLDRGVPTIAGTGCWRESPLFSFSIACREQVYIVAVPYALPRKWALLIHLRTRQTLVTYGLCNPVWRHIVGNFSQIKTG